MKQAVGIDIGTETVKVAALAGGGPRFSLIGLNWAKIPPQSWQTDTLQNTAEIAKIITSSLIDAKPHRINCKNAMVALPESVIFSTSIVVPKLKPREMSEAIRLQAAEQLSLNPEECYFDYEIIGSEAVSQSTGLSTKKNLPLTQKSGGQINAFVVAAKMTLVDSVIDTIKQANLMISGIDIKPAAIGRAILNTDNKISFLIVDLGYYSTGVGIVYKGMPHITSTVPVGAKDFYDEKSMILTKTGRSRLSQIFDEIVHIIRYYENRLFPDRKVTEARLVGLGANCEDITNIFKTETGLKTELGDPFLKVKTPKIDFDQQMKLSFGDAIGLAMRRD